MMKFRRNMKILICLVLATVMLAGCFNVNETTRKTTDVRQITSKQVPIAANATPQAQKVILAGSKYLGVPYEYGSNRHTTTTFDCSDFVRQAFYDGLKLKLPYDSRKQADYVRSVGNTTTMWRKLKPGDLLFFMSYRGTRAANYQGINKASQRITHVGIYLGGGKMLHTYSKQSGGVRVDNIMANHWEYRFIFGGNALTNNVSATK
jgi:cell wall-associated NlpC family hydrolase